MTGIDSEQPRGAERSRAFNDSGSAHICFTNDDIEGGDIQRQFAGRARRINSPRKVPDGPNRGGRVAHLADPENAVELHQLARPWGAE